MSLSLTVMLRRLLPACEAANSCSNVSALVFQPLFVAYINKQSGVRSLFLFPSLKHFIHGPDQFLSALSSHITAHLSVPLLLLSAQLRTSLQVQSHPVALASGSF